MPRQRFDLKIIKHVPHASYVGEWSQFWGRRSGAHGVYVMAAAPARYNVCVWGQAINHMCIQVVRFLCPYFYLEIKFPASHWRTALIVWASGLPSTFQMNFRWNGVASLMAYMNCLSTSELFKMFYAHPFYIID